MKESLRRAANALNAVSANNPSIGHAVGVLLAAAEMWPYPAPQAPRREVEDAITDYREGFEAGVEAARDLEPQGYGDGFRTGWIAGTSAYRGLVERAQVRNAPPDISQGDLAALFAQIAEAEQSDGPTLGDGTTLHRWAETMAKSDLGQKTSAGRPDLIAPDTDLEGDPVVSAPGGWPAAVDRERAARAQGVAAELVEQLIGRGLRPGEVRNAPLVVEVTDRVGMGEQFGVTETRVPLDVVADPADEDTDELPASGVVHPDDESERADDESDEGARFAVAIELDSAEQRHVERPLGEQVKAENDRDWRIVASSDHPEPSEDYRTERPQ